MTALAEQGLKPDRTRLAAMFAEFVDPAFIIADAETQKPYECDGLSAYCEMPLLVVLPQTVEQVQRVMKICHHYDIPVVARGAGTGLCGGAMPNDCGVLLSLARLNRILAIDPLARTARVQTGVLNLSVSEAAAAHGLYYAPDPSSQIACTIGGNIAENSGGIHCLKYGLTVHNVLKITFVNVEGELCDVGSEGLDSAGCDLLALMTGSEGLLGIAVEAVLNLLPIQERARIVIAGFDNVQNAGDAVSRIISRRIIPAGLEFLDSHAIKAAEAFCSAGYPVEAAALLLCELDGTEHAVEAELSAVIEIFQQFGATSIRVSQSDEERALLWKGRKSAFPAVGSISPDYYCMDGTIPRAKLAEVLAEIGRLSRHYGLRVANVFHAGDGNLHPLILFDANVPGEFAKTEQFGGRILELCVAAGGSITGEHGVGVEKLRQMRSQFNERELAQFHAIKTAFDPRGTLNPGKGIPVLKNCQEYRALAPAVNARLVVEHG